MCTVWQAYVVRDWNNSLRGMRPLVVIDLQKSSSWRDLTRDPAQQYAPPPLLLPLVPSASLQPQFGSQTRQLNPHDNNYLIII